MPADAANLDIGGRLRETGPMSRWVMAPIVAALFCISAAVRAAGDDIGNSPWMGLEDFSRGEFTAQARPRFNRIDEDDKPDRAQGGTYRLLAGWRSGPVAGARFTIEGVNTGFIGHKGFNTDSAQFASSEYPLLPDPRYTGVNQLFIEMKRDTWRVKAGRQVVRLDNQRWVSDNDFRQVPQVFDGVRAFYTGVPDTELEASWFRRQRDTSGDLQDLRLSVLRAAWNPWRDQSLTAYGIFHDQPDNGAFTGFANNSYRVAGLRFEGTLSMRAGVDAVYAAEVAQQKPYAGGDSRIDARYWRVGGGMSSARLTLRADYEVKGSNAGRYGVQMPLTDFYAWNGWTLHFFNTPFQGLRDGWVTLRALTLPSLTAYVEGHRYRSDAGGLDFGHEVDLGLTYEIAPEAIVRLQHARYDGAVGGSDVRKLWLTLTWTY